MLLKLAIILAIFVAGYSIPAAVGSQDCGDVNDDAAVNIRDITSLINFLYKVGPEPNCPNMVPTLATASMPCQGDDSVEIAFRKSEQTLGNTRSFGVAIADVDLDGDNDIFVANYIGPSQLWLNDGEGVFSASPHNFNISEVHGVGIRDLNGDAYPDIFLLSHASPSKVYFGSGSGTFTPGDQNIGLGTDYPGMIVLGDVDGDGDIDAFISYYQLPNRLWLNNGTGFFTMTSPEFGGGNGSEMELADVNGDTFLDLFISFQDQPDEIWINDGSGNFVKSGQELGSSTGYEHVSSGDVDGDSDIDFAVDNSATGVTIWLNENNTGSFIEAGPYFEAGASRAKLFDADLDGDPDLITTHQGNGNKLWINNGSGGFTSLGQLFGSARAASVACGRLDNDDDFDVVFGMAENGGSNPIYFNESVHIAAGVCGDVNADCVVNIKDITYLIKYLYQGGPAPICPNTVPILTTADISEITQTTAQCGGNITSDGGATVTARGVCWSTGSTPTVADEKTTEGTGTGIFASSLTGLAARTTYYVRAYATNSAGTGYGSILSFMTTDSMGTVTDIDGNIYRTIKIGDQWWMMENIEVTHYRNGDPIPNVTDSSTWASLTSGAYCNYNNDEANVATYGRMYNWYAATDSRNIAPAGWHVVSDIEWQTLINYLGGDAVAGWKMKETGTVHWLPPNSGTNGCGFTALPGGYRGSNYAVFADLGNYACFWTSTAINSSYAWYRSISYNNPEVSRYDSRKFYAFSIRCVRD